MNRKRAGLALVLFAAVTRAAGLPEMNAQEVPLSEMKRPAGPPEMKDDYVTVNGVRLHYVSAGSGPLILFLHGFPEFWYAWTIQLVVFGNDCRSEARVRH